MTHDETRDELARMDGWVKQHIGWWTTDGLKSSYNHPHAPTLNGANAAVPECFKWRRFSDCWVATHDDRETVVEVPVTGETPEHKINDLYALALACRHAMEERK